MARGNEILVNGQDPKGRFSEGFAKSGQTIYPGMIVQKDPTVALKGGRHTYKIYDRDLDGDRPAGAFWVVLNDLHAMLGNAVGVAIPDGGRLEVYAPLPGDELNLLKGDVAGTGDDFTAGDLLIVDDGTGKVILTTGTPETEVAMALESIVDPTADVLVWCEWTGQ